MITRIKEKSKQVWGKIKDAGSWIKRRSKKFWAGVVALIITPVAAAIMTGEPEFISGQDIISEIATRQAECIKDNDRYCRLKEFINSESIKDSPFKVIIHTYKAPGNNYGYRVILENDEVKKSVGYGVHADMFTWEIIKTATTTQ